MTERPVVEAEGLDADPLAAALTVADLPASVAWYCDALGFRIEREFVREGVRRSVRVTAGAVRLLLNQDDGTKGTERQKGVGCSFMLTTRQSVDALAARAAAHGELASAPADTPWGGRAFRVRDPDGFLFTISSPVV